MRTEESIAAAAASKALRKATTKIASKIRVEPNHTRYPSDDFENITDMIPEKMDEKALIWYEKGIRRGFNKSTDMMLAGKFKLRGSTLTGPRKIKFKVRTKFTGGDYITRTIIIDSEEIGFK